MKKQGYEAYFDVDEGDSHTDEFQNYFCNLIKKAFVAAIVGFPLMINKFWQWLPSINQSCIQWLWVMAVGYYY
ncbi:hypothetical protein [Candidatus Coxiella mudrowiae]|uniref:hypothetical protein n=1 Tax=Candidatus Coxiella mudrowiae TaxID=2054173 RepID=UPI0006622C58|nr:hypothetical protein [Candidatus Coxiella mudrowiae]